MKIPTHILVTIYFTSIFFLGYQIIKERRKLVVSERRLQNVTIQYEQLNQQNKQLIILLINKKDLK